MTFSNYSLRDFRRRNLVAFVSEEKKAGGPAGDSNFLHRIHQDFLLILLFQLWNIINSKQSFIYLIRRANRDFS